MIETYQEAKNNLLFGDLSAGNFFEQNNYVLEFAYSKLLAGDLKSAEFNFSKISNLDLRADWAKKLIQFIRCKVYEAPSYFQIRNFLEIDLNLLFIYEQPQFVENVINGADIFYSINPESYKFIARVMLNNDFVDVALIFLLRAKDNLFQDPEMHFMLAHCYVRQDDNELAIASLKNCLSILPGYFPATRLLARLQQ